MYLPLSRPLFVYVKASSLDRPEVQKFMDFYVRFGSDIVDRVGSVRLSPREAELSLDRLTKRTPGTIFSGDEGDLSLEMRVSKK